ncbi:MAG: WG repeat-containing protein [Acidobacteria bacterium]|nr:WG repeat-containing protein [Acidobacteriota bacterium]
MFFAGQQFGRYTLVKQIGKGAYGEVWLAMRHAKFVTTKVAVKLPNTDQIDFDAIRQEAILWEQASGHPNVLPIIEADEFDGQVVIVSEYASDGTLDDILGRNGKLPLRKTVELALGIAHGLEFLHSRRIVHRDVKPANVLLQGDTPRLTDFGMSRVVLSNSISMQVSGTPYYMAPEAFRRKRDRQSDIWSFGVVLYEMLTGEMPFPGDEVDEICQAVLNDKPLPLPKTVPRELRSIILRALEKSPADRYQSVSEMREDLQNLVPKLSEYETHGETFANETETPVAVPERKAKHSFFNHSQLVPEHSGRSWMTRLLSMKLLILLILTIGFAATAGVYFMSRPHPVPFRKGDKFGFSTWEKQTVVEPRYDLARPFTFNRALVGIGTYDGKGEFQGKFGFVDPQGREVIAPEYDDAESFSEKLAKVGRFTASTSDRRYGYIDQSGNIVVPFTFEAAHGFSESLAAVRFQGKWGFIDTNSGTVVPFDYDGAQSFSGGYAVVERAGKFGYVDKKGALVIQPAFDFAGNFSAGKAPVKKDGRAFFIDTSGREVLSADYSSAAQFSEGFAMVTSGGKSGFIDQKGEVAVPFIYECESSRFSEGLAAVPLNGRFGYINRYGTLVIPFRFRDAAPFNGNLARVRSAADGREFYISFDGTEFFAP